MDKSIVKEPIVLEDVNNILKAAVKVGAEIEEFPGVLNDNYILSDMHMISIDKGKPTNYVILLAEYATTISNNLYMIRTNDEEVADHYRELFDVEN